MKKIDAATIEKILDHLAKSLSPSEKVELEKFKTIDLIRSKWTEIVSQILSEHSFPWNLHDNRLYVVTDHSIYGQEILLHQNIILKKINELTGLNISTIKTTVDKNFWSYTPKKKSDITPQKKNLTHVDSNLTQEEKEIQQYLKNLSAEMKKQK